MKESIKILPKIKSPSDVKRVRECCLTSLADEMRRVIVDTVSKNGGHLASNLGMVETTLAIHRVFDLPKDSVVFDVSHQSYAHKLLTGRYESFGSLRKMGGLSGFTNPEESEHDIFYEGHSGTSVSAALGIAKANKLRGSDAYTVAVVGDGSMTNGMIWEALNNCSEEELNLIILINDNEMSISENIGGVHSYFTKIRTSRSYFSLKRGLEGVLSKIPLVGRPFVKLLKFFKDTFKHMVQADTLFEDLGLIYLGPVDGNDVSKMEMILAEARKIHRCTVVHMMTRKGLGYKGAEDEPSKYHSVGKFDADGGIITDTGIKTLSDAFGDAVCALAEKDGRICAVTAAMCDGTGLARFSESYPDRFFDVGIAEEHAVTFSGGLLRGGMKPILALYSTFSQRVYDQLIHDIAIQRLPLTLCLDRCGLVAGDGITHQGIFDYAPFSAIPGTQIYSVSSGTELSEALEAALSGDGLTVIRYPKGEATETSPEFIRRGQLYFTEGTGSAKTVIVTHGRLSENALCAAKMLGSVGVVKLVRIFPLDLEAIGRLTANADLIYVLDESYESGGMGEKLAAGLCTSARIKIRAVKGFVPHGKLSELYGLCGFTPEQIADEIKNEVANGQ